jgi:hypothetical protein
VGLKSLKSLNLTNGYPKKNKKKNNNNNKVKSKPLELFELAGKNFEKPENFEIFEVVEVLICILCQNIDILEKIIMNFFLNFAAI